VLLAWLTLRRSEFGLSARRLASLALESLLCSPFALNLVRKVSMGMPVREDLVLAARRLQQAKQWDESKQRIRERLEDELDAEEGDSEQAAALKRYRDRVLADCAPCP
jgi:hypothetical protein